MLGLRRPPLLRRGGLRRVGFPGVVHVLAVEGHVVADVGDHLVLARAAGVRVVAARRLVLRRVDEVVAFTADQRVAALLARYPVLAGAAVQRVVALAAVHPVVAGAAVQRVVAAAAVLPVEVVVAVAAV